MKTGKAAFVKSLPVMAGYIILGIGFGILAHSAGYGFPWVLAMSLLIFAGSMQYVGIGMLAGGASVLTVILTTVMVNSRHLFYSISMFGRYKDMVVRLRPVIGDSGRITEWIPDPDTAAAVDRAVAGGTPPPAPTALPAPSYAPPFNPAGIPGL